MISPERSVGIRQLRASLARHLAWVEAGETVIVERAGRPVARLGPLDETPAPNVGLEEMARLGLIERPRVVSPETGAADQAGLPVDVAVDRIVRQIRG